MNTIEPDSSHEAAARESADRQRSHDIETDQQAARSDKAASGRQATQDAEVERAREVGALEERLVATGGGGRGRRLLLIGIDGASPELAIGAWRTDLRTFHMLTDRGAWGRLYGSPPWNSTAAWFALLSGQDSGQLGIYGPRRRVSHSYAAPLPSDGRAIGEMRLWDLLGRAGKHVGVVGAPLTTPAPPIHGHMIGDRFLESDLAISPPSLRQQVALWLEDSPQLQPAGTGDPIEQLI